MKKHLAFLLALLMALSLVACGGENGEKNGALATPPEVDGSADAVGDNLPNCDDSKLPLDDTTTKERVAFQQSLRIYSTNFASDEPSSHLRVISSKEDFEAATKGLSLTDEIKTKYEKLPGGYFDNFSWCLFVMERGSSTIVPTIQKVERITSKNGDVSYAITWYDNLPVNGMNMDDMRWVLLIEDCSGDMTNENVSLVYVE
ncbi:MAG: hypothetical protein E7599_02410 [Ruminococcaceae bacterium]|nr:hypothetical protein [Oscillospiraceae bacterium]